jgi:hypothetical protein
MRSVSAMLLRFGSQSRSAISPRELRVVNLAIPVLIQDVEKVVGLRRGYTRAERREPPGQFLPVDRAVAILIEVPEHLQSPCGVT